MLGWTPKDAAAFETLHGMFICWFKQIVIDIASLILLILSLTVEIFGAAQILSGADNRNSFIEHPTECTLETVFGKVKSGDRSQTT